MPGFHLSTLDSRILCGEVDCLAQMKLIVWHKCPIYMMLYSMIILLFDIDGPLI